MGCGGQLQAGPCPWGCWLWLLLTTALQFWVENSLLNSGVVINLEGFLRHKCCVLFGDTCCFRLFHQWLHPQALCSKVSEGYK